MSAAMLGSVALDGHCLRKGWISNTRNQRFSTLNVRSSIDSSSRDSVRLGILGASGYTGCELLRLLKNHPQFQVSFLTADRKAGLPVESVFGHLVGQNFPNLIAIDDADFSKVDAVLCCLPHGTTQEIIKGLPEHLKIVDLSADFRLRNVNEYEQWYGQPHRAPELQKEAVYGLTEVIRRDIRHARLVANPGCYPTCTQLPLIPLIKAGLIKLINIIIDAKSAVSGAGRGAKEANLYCEVAESIKAYGVTNHRHVPEIEQGLSDASGFESNNQLHPSFDTHEPRNAN
ncbi:hypothetical protein QJS10_CPA01g02520 [Acorus calamus]|uniref:Semialdehyde dehydrogenase NAD-binding domain-containing protein n=1 Tax=Acorus calamus TaxID=4465 RepID=A0AAV9FKA4_ACOCL|nr:hypothetical protein QJS10_CPA01g02520 [Acorus calamus]